MRKYSALFCLIICSLVKAQHTNPIQEAIANYDYEEALLLIEQTEEITIPLLYQKGRALKSLGNYTEALKVYQEVAEQDSLNPRAYVEVAECYRTLTKYKQALKYYEQALELNPDNKYVTLQYIQLLLLQKKFQEAFGESSVLSERDSSAIVLHLQAQSLEGMGDYLPALGCYHNIQEKYPNDYLAAAKLGQIYNAGKDYNDAIKATEQYRDIDSTNIVVNQQNALAYCLKKDYPTAIQRYEYLLSQGDSSFYTCYYLGISYYAVQRLYDAHDVLEIARTYDPRNVNLLYYLGRACSKTSWKEKGVDYLEEAIAYSLPTDSAMTRLYIGMSDCYKKAGMYNEQLKALQERYQKYDIENHRLLYDMAYIYNYQLKNPRQAERHLIAFLKTRPKEGEEKQPEFDEEGNLVLSKTNYYNAAENWLNNLQKKRKEEEFFQGNPVAIADTSEVTK